MKQLLILSVFLICLYECYWPVPDYDKEKFDKYCNIPIKDTQLKAECIYFEITPDKLKVYINNRPKLNHGELKIINKYKTWLNEKDN